MLKEATLDPPGPKRAGTRPFVMSVRRAPVLVPGAESRTEAGRIGIVNYKPGRGGPGPDPQRRLDSRVVETEAVAAGLRVLDSAMLPFQYLLVVGK